ncbi:unnamed protein product, partial [Iphiclides podalirius]
MAILLLRNAKILLQNLKQNKLKFQKKETKLMRNYLFRNLTPFIAALVKILLMNHLPQVEDHKETDLKSIQETAQEKEYPYRETVGSLLHLSTRTRSDIAQAVNLVSRKVENPTREDVTKFKKIFKYLVGTKEKGILFKRNKPIENIDAYSESDYAGDPLTRSASGSVLMIADRPISWASKR